ncbi:MAG: MoxR family ATPase [Saprospiraceae bacterium]
MSEIIPNAEMQDLQYNLHQESEFIDRLRKETARIIVGQEDMIDRLLIGLLTGGHILLEGMPGLAKTMTIKVLAHAIDAKLARIQFTPDLLPSDIVGTMIYNPAQAGFTVKKGPIFANLVLADEINRAPAKVQSALLEAMQEKQVTIGEQTFKLEEPFLVLATQNPIEQEGTYPLPEAQVDRFLLKVLVTYPNREAELEIMRRSVNGEAIDKINAIVHPKEILAARESVKKVYMDEKIEKYILDLVTATREPHKNGLPELQALIRYGASPRASISLVAASKAYAFMQRRSFVIPDDVRAIAYEVLRHRIGLSYEAEAENIHADNIIDKILQKTWVP